MPPVSRIPAQRAAQSGAREVDPSLELLAEAGRRRAYPSTKCSSFRATPDLSTATVPSPCVEQQMAQDCVGGHEISTQQIPGRCQKGLPPFVGRLLDSAIRRKQQLDRFKLPSEDLAGHRDQRGFGTEVPRSTARMTGSLGGIGRPKKAWPGLFTAEVAEDAEGKGQNEKCKVQNVRRNDNV